MCIKAMFAYEIAAIDPTTCQCEASPEAKQGGRTEAYTLLHRCNSWKPIEIIERLRSMAYLPFNRRQLKLLELHIFPIPRGASPDANVKWGDSRFTPVALQGDRFPAVAAHEDS